jgi:hypothetical protein
MLPVRVYSFPFLWIGAPAGSMLPSGRMYIVADAFAVFRLYAGARRLTVRMIIVTCERVRLIFLPP